VGSLDRRLQRVEERTLGERGERRLEPWENVVIRWQIERNKLIRPDVRRARDLIRLYHTQNLLSGMSADEVVQRIFDWKPPLAEMRRHCVEREVALAVYRRWPSTENMVCAPHWRESFVAADELVRQITADLQRGLSEQDILELEESEETELERKAIGPDRELIDEDEALWRLLDYGDPVWSDESLWRHKRSLAFASRQGAADDGAPREAATPGAPR
jgi:hypothetical protein